jgi:hypothetical protein
MKSEDTASATSSPDSGAGHWLADSPALTQGFLFGPPASRASRSRKRGPARRKKTTDTSGPISFASSASAALSASLANRLLERRVIGGSTEYDLRWKRLVTPSGLVLYRLLPQARRTAACDTSGVPSGWPTATVRDEKGREGQPSKASLEGSGHGRQVLAEAAHLTEPPAPWPTPGAMETSREEGMRPSRAATGRKVGYLSEAVVSYGAPAPWQTPTVVDLTGRPYTYPSGDHSRPFLTLPGQAALTDAPSPWASPAVRVILCRDGKHRRVPVEPGFQPLAHGIPFRKADPRLAELLARLRGMGYGPAAALALVKRARAFRKGALRAAGNAIVPQVAAIFLECFLGAEQDMRASR